MTMKKKVDRDDFCHQIIKIVNFLVINTFSLFPNQNEDSQKFVDFEQECE